MQADTSSHGKSAYSSVITPCQRGIMLINIWHQTFFQIIDKIVKGRIMFLTKEFQPTTISLFIGTAIREYNDHFLCVLVCNSIPDDILNFVPIKCRFILADAMIHIYHRIFLILGIALRQNDLCLSGNDSIFLNHSGIVCNILHRSRHLVIHFIESIRYTRIRILDIWTDRLHDRCWRLRLKGSFCLFRFLRLFWNLGVLRLAA